MEEQKTKPSKLQNQLTAIVLKTITRNTNDSESDFLKKLGMKEDVELQEEKVVASMMINALVEITKQLLEIENSLISSTEVIKLLLNEEQQQELKNKLKESEE